MDDLRTIKAELQELLTDEYPALAWEPERPAPPCIIMRPGSPYLAPSEQYGCLTLRLGLRILAPIGPAPGPQNDLDKALKTVLPLIQDHTEFYIRDVSSPYLLQIGQLAFPAIDINIDTPINI